jgi:hypothetical protein
MSNINIAIVPKREGLGYPSPFDASTPKAFGNGWVTTAGSRPGEGAGWCRHGGGRHRAWWDQRTRAFGLARLPKWLEETR